MNRAEVDAWCVRLWAAETKRCSNKAWVGYRQGSWLPLQPIIMALLHLDVGKVQDPLQDPLHAPLPLSRVPFGDFRPDISSHSLSVSAHGGASPRTACLLRVFFYAFL